MKTAFTLLCQILTMETDFTLLCQTLTMETDFTLLCQTLTMETAFTLLCQILTMETYFTLLCQTLTMGTAFTLSDTIKGQKFPNLTLAKAKIVISLFCNMITYISSKYVYFFRWLLKDPNMKVRSNYPPYQKAVERFFNKLIPLVADLQVRLLFTSF
jgi:hypothetical protein